MRSSTFCQLDGCLSISSAKVWDAFSGRMVPRCELRSVNSVTRAPSAKRAFQWPIGTSSTPVVLQPLDHRAERIDMGDHCAVRLLRRPSQRGADRARRVSSTGTPSLSSSSATRCTARSV